ncbi:hypothetical protein V5799_025374 [Amblyomma americanum]|uniref:Uncharacterized protein n=1 Tax=Amblyomma americanum TaxID=6943 RepID=A0AAQ4E9W2_AMBAM
MMMPNSSQAPNNLPNKLKKAVGWPTCRYGDITAQRYNLQCTGMYGRGPTCQERYAAGGKVKLQICYVGDSTVIPLSFM